jgi:adenylate kinase family enzyme
VHAGVLVAVFWERWKRGVVVTWVFPILVQRINLGLMMKVAIMGNSGSGKSTLAHRLAAGGPAAVLDLDLVFWQSGVAVERPSEERIAEVRRFCAEHDSWIIEGCYADLIEASLDWEPELIFLDPGLEACVANCRRRPHEPHKYRSKEEQDEKLEFLIQWVEGYYDREGLMSYSEHKRLFERYGGVKRRETELS